MDQDKIGKLIASLRKKQGLTQSELGAKVGVGDRAVSKWERGLTTPDISIINDLSKILGITSDELLAGELNKENKLELAKFENNSNKKKTNIFLLGIIAFVIIIAGIFFYIGINKSYEYRIFSNASEDYQIGGHVVIKNRNISIFINELNFSDKELLGVVVKNYEYYITADGVLILSRGNLGVHDLLLENITVEELLADFAIDSVVPSNIDVKNNLDKEWNLRFAFLDVNDNEIVKEIKFSLVPVK